MYNNNNVVGVSKDWFKWSTRESERIFDKKSWGQRNLKSKSESTTYKIQLNKGYIEVIMVLVNNNWTCFTCKLT